MTEQTNATQAWLIGAPDIPLSIRGGRLTLDQGRSPHVQGTIEIAIPAQETLTALDPRLGARVRTQVQNTDAFGVTSTRTFDLGLRSRPTRHRDAVVSLAVASDEAILDEQAPLADDNQTTQTSLRSLIDYALKQAIIVRRNVAPNPKGGVDTTGWLSTASAPGVVVTERVTGANPAGVSSRVQARCTTAPTAAGGYIDVRASIPVVAGTVYSVAAFGYYSAGGSSTAYLQWRDASSNILSTVTVPTGVAPATWARTTLIAGVAAPSGAVSATVIYRANSTAAAPIGVGAFATMTAVLFEAGGFAGDYFDGDSVRCVWEGAANESPSREIPHLAWTPALDADITPYYALTNLHPNPVPASANGYTGGAGANAPTYNAGPPSDVRWTTTAAVSNLICAGSLTAFRVTPGKTYVFAILWASASAGRTAQPIIQWRTNGSASVVGNVYGTAKSYDPNYQELTVVATAPPGAEYAYPIVQTSGNAATTTHLVRSMRFYEGAEVVPPFSGATPATAQYSYAWGDPTAPNASPSIRTPLVDSPARDALICKAGMSWLDFLSPLVQRYGYRLVCDEQRVWTLRDASYVAAGSLYIAHGVNLIDATDTLDRASEDWFDGAAFVYTWRDRDGIPQERVDSWSLTATPQKVVRREIDAPWPGPGRAQYAVQRAQGRGREVTATRISDLTARAEQPVQIILNGAPIQTGAAQSVEFDLDRDEITVTARTTDTPPTAWVLLAAGQRWIDSPAGGSWIGE